MGKLKDWCNYYEKIEELGEGGNAKVYRIRDKNGNSEFALKELYNMSVEKKSRFIDEINVIGENYDNIQGIMPIIKASMTEYWYIMPIATSILDYIEESKAMPEDIVRGVIQLARTLSQLHSKQVSHRDIKPSNIYYYNEGYYLGDFGLVDLPDNPNDFTRSDRGLGAIFTIAPEMKRDPKNSDGKCADVFSLAKTLWMLLSKNDKGFDGVYNFMDKSHSLRFMERFKNVHLVELEELLISSTQNNPDNRPNINEFIEQLEQWLDIYSNYDKSQESDWRFLQSYLFGEHIPERTSWTNIDTIVNVLNIIGSLPAFNHMMLPDGGGTDFLMAIKAEEEGCIYLSDDSMKFGLLRLIKPKRLNFVSYNPDNVWNYFFLELEELKPIFEETPFKYEYLVEDMPGHYVSANYAQYGVYDYETGELFPEGFKLVDRYYCGNMMIVLKKSPYNQISGTYDGRHNMTDFATFSSYIDNLRSKYNQLIKLGYPEQSIVRLSHFKVNPFKYDLEDESKYDDAIFLSNLASEDAARRFVGDTYYQWCFKELLLFSDEKSNVEFFICFKWKEHSLGRFLSQEITVLCRDGYVRTIKRSEIDEYAYYIYDRDEAYKLKKNCQNKILQMCENEGYMLDEDSVYFYINLKRCGTPTHLFTKDEIKQLMQEADDRVSNVLVIDENGHAHIISERQKARLYPVRHETWEAGNNYVGKYSSLSTVDDNYISSLQGWLIYLKGSKSVYMNYIGDNKNEEQLLEEIKKYY